MYSLPLLSDPFEPFDISTSSDLSKALVLARAALRILSKRSVPDDEANFTEQQGTVIQHVSIPAALRHRINLILLYLLYLS